MSGTTGDVRDRLDTVRDLQHGVICAEQGICHSVSLRRKNVIPLAEKSDFRIPKTSCVILLPWIELETVELRTDEYDLGLQHVGDVRVQASVVTSASLARTCLTLLRC